MNVERLHAIFKVVQEDFEESGLQTDLGQLVEALQNQVNSPQEPSFQKSVSDHLTSLYEALSESAINDFSPTWKQALKELRADDILGENLKIRLQDVFERNQITPSVALDEIREMQAGVDQFKDALTEILNGFEKLSIGAEELEPGGCEMGILIPRDSVDNHLVKLGEELAELEQIFLPFTELATASRPSFEVRSVSTTDFSVYLDMLPPTAACIAFALREIITGYKVLTEIRMNHKNLRDKGVPKKNLKGIEDWANDLIDKRIEKLIPDLEKRFNKVKDDARNNELSNDLRFSLRKIANRVDKGYNIEVRVEPEEVEEEEDGTKASPKEQALIQIIQDATKTLEYIKLGGEPILSLPESEKKEKSKK